MMSENEKTVIYVDHVTKDYGQGRGDFDITLDIKQGETMGIVGENGAGKTTLIRQMMGFIKPDKGHINIYNLDAYKDSANTKQHIGYIPGEINFPDVKTGTEFLHSYGESLGMKKDNFAYADEIIKRMQLDIRAYPRRMSKGMKQKTAIVSAFMLKAPIIIMDEPTTGLDPLMRDELLTLVEEQKQRGATMFISSNTIEELERVCDRVALISQGHIVDIANVKDIKNRYFRDFKIEFNNEEQYVNFLKGRDDIIRVQPEFNQVTLRVDRKCVDLLLDDLSKMDVKYISEVKYNLANYFNDIRKSKKGV